MTPPQQMKVTVHFYSYFKELTGCPKAGFELSPGATLGDALQQICTRFPKLAEMRRSMLMAVGVDYQDGSYKLKAGDEVSLFPPVQGG